MQGPQGVLENGARNGGSVLGSRLYSCPQRMARKYSQCNALLLTPLLIGLIRFSKSAFDSAFCGIFFVENTFSVLFLEHLEVTELFCTNSSPFSAYFS